MSKFTAAHVRRAALAAAPIATAATVIVGGFADPDPSGQGLDLVRTYAQHWDAVQLKSVSYHYAYTFFAATALGVAALVRHGRGVGLSLVAGGLALLTVSTMPGMLGGDLYSSAGGQAIGAEQMHAIETQVYESWTSAATAVPAKFGLLLGLPLAMLAAVRAGFMRWYMPLVAVAAFFAMVMGAGSVIGAAIVAALFAALSASIARIPVAAFGGRTARDLADEHDARRAAADATELDAATPVAV